MKTPTLSTNTKIILGVLALGILLAAIYFLFFNTSGDTSAISTTGAPASAAEVTFLDLASKVDPINFDTSIFTDPRFTSLVDIHQAIVPDTAGRTDPFAPLPGMAASGSTDGSSNGTTGSTQ